MSRWYTILILLVVFAPTMHLCESSGLGDTTAFPLKANCILEIP
jgi:hypothetical protein